MNMVALLIELVLEMRCSLHSGYMCLCVST